MYPTFLCIGATKAGTTWLHEQLSTHPEVCMPVIKELHYFTALHVPGARRWATGTVTGSMQRELRKAQRAIRTGAGDARMLAHVERLIELELFSPAWYQECFSRPDRSSRVRGEITPAYSELPDAGIREICAAVPDIRIIHLLRHPLQRALSHLRMTINRGKIASDEATLIRWVNRGGELITRGEYQLHLPRWEAHIPPERMKIVPFGAIRRDPQALMREIEQFLGAHAFSSYPVEKRVHSTDKVEIPASVTALLAEKVQPAVDYLTRRFGPKFVLETL